MASRAAQAASLLLLHRLLSHIERDTDGFVLRNLPLRLRHLVRHRGKPFADALVNALLAAALPLLQPPRLRAVHAHEHHVAPGLVLDVFRPALPPPAPLLLFVHGGIWTLGERRQYRAFGQRLAAEGMVAVVVGYRTWPEAGASEQVRAVRAALAFAKAHAASWGGEASRVYLSGQSSGANVSALALIGSASVSCAGFIGSAPPRRRRAPARRAPPQRRPPPRAVGGCYDVVAHFAYESRRGVEQASMLEPACAPLEEHSPLLLVRRHRRPLACERVLLLHGEHDVTVPPSSSALFALELVRLGQQASYIPLHADAHLSFLIDASLGRDCELLVHLKRFCSENGNVARL
ncbi:hypothetical protein AB1Y20_005823 [Prymnesium parvum]|uniref:BD-FAE-like domain-containing protein n=1 Tax=Prymnesium parvum TaxID=97485 RepID=A0AB34J2V0_PRYPA